MIQNQTHVKLYSLFALALVFNFVFWMQSRYVRAEWENVPPVPNYYQLVFSALGDTQLAYRSTANMLQNIGSTGGHIRPLGDTNYVELAKWLDLTLELDKRSNTVPHLAAYYYGAGQDTEKIREIMPYIYEVGTLDQPNNWRWLAHGVYLARHRIGDNDLALKFADTLAFLEQPDMPIWTKQMRAFIQYDQGEKQAAYDILKQIMISGVDTLPPQEIFTMKDYICNRILEPVEASIDPLCQN